MWEPQANRNHITNWWLHTMSSLSLITDDDVCDVNHTSAPCDACHKDNERVMGPHHYQCPNVDYTLHDLEHACPHRLCDGCWEACIRSTIPENLVEHGIDVSDVCIVCPLCNVDVTSWVIEVFGEENTILPNEINVSDTTSVYSDISASPAPINKDMIETLLFGNLSRIIERIQNAARIHMEEYASYVDAPDEFVVYMPSVLRDFEYKKMMTVFTHHEALALYMKAFNVVGDALRFLVEENGVQVCITMRT